MTVSVLIPTYNRADLICNLLSALETQTYQAPEIILVNDGSTDNTLDVLDNFIGQSSLNLNVHSIPNAGRAGARNFAVQKATGDLLIFFDDDTRPNPDAVAHHVKHHRELDKVLISGPYLYDSSRFECDFNFFRQWMELQWTEITDKLLPSANLRINGGNFSIKRDHFMLTGGFDERLFDKEDFKLAFDFSIKCNGEVYTSFSTWVYHDDFRDLLPYIERERASRCEEQKLRAIEPVIAVMFPERFDVLPPPGIKYNIARALRLPLVLSFLQKVLETRLLQRRLKYRIYDWIITMNIKYL